MKIEDVTGVPCDERGETDVKSRTEHPAGIFKEKMT
jgi:hypothetical protein